MVDTPTDNTTVDIPIRRDNGEAGLPNSIKIGVNETVRAAVVTENSFSSRTVLPNGPVYTSVD